MSDLVSAVRKNVSKECCVTQCRKEGCKVHLPKELYPFVLIDMDCSDSPAAENEKRCDYLLVSRYRSKDWVVPMELKKGGGSSSNIIAQLQAGALVADKIVPCYANVEFRPVAVYGGGLSRHEWMAFRSKNNKVKFRQKQEVVRLTRCGADLSKVLRAS